jgi:hypothetical protein
LVAEREKSERERGWQLPMKRIFSMLAAVASAFLAAGAVAKW